jgi:hypothetical protein
LGTTGESFIGGFWSAFFGFFSKKGGFAAKFQNFLAQAGDL